VQYVGIFGVDTYPVVDDVNNALSFIHNDLGVITSTSNGPDKIVRVACKKRGMKVKTISYASMEVKEHKSILPTINRMFKENEVCAIIAFWTSRTAMGCNIGYVFSVLNEARKRHVPIKVIRPTGIWAERRIRATSE